jgi:hypothetical protein
MEPSKFSVSFFVKLMALQILLIDLGLALGPSFFTASLKIRTQKRTCICEKKLSE